MSSFIEIKTGEETQPLLLNKNIVLSVKAFNKNNKNTGAVITYILGNVLKDIEVPGNFNDIKKSFLDS